jgi:putative ABC transport system permease protein
MGTTSIMVSIQQRNTKQVEPQEMFEFVEQNPDLFANVSPSVSLGGTLKIPSGGDDSITASCTGVAETYAEMKDLKMSFGRFLQYIDCERESKVCVVGTYEALYFYGSASNALNNTIKINGVPYTIVGVLEETEDSTSSSGDDVVYIPYTTAAKQNGSATVSSYTLDAVDEDSVTSAVASAKAFLLEKIGDEDYYTVTSMLSMIDKMTTMLDTMSTVLVAIAGISLLVGGIGIMNIMLVSVTERTREIGIRKSLGARQKHIMMQFVIEAGTVSCLGGIIGIILGIVVAMSAGKVLDMTVVPSSSAVILAFGVSVAIGIVFGFLPAKKAARLNPIDALRYD